MDNSTRRVLLDLVHTVTLSDTLVVAVEYYSFLIIIKVGAGVPRTG